MSWGDGHPGSGGGIRKCANQGRGSQGVLGKNDPQRNAPGRCDIIYIASRRRIQGIRHRRFVGPGVPNLIDGDGLAVVRNLFGRMGLADWIEHGTKEDKGFFRPGLVTEIRITLLLCRSGVSDDMPLFRQRGGRRRVFGCVRVPYPVTFGHRLRRATRRSPVRTSYLDDGPAPSDASRECCQAADGTGRRDGRRAQRTGAGRGGRLFSDPRPASGGRHLRVEPVSIPLHLWFRDAAHRCGCQPRHDPSPQLLHDTKPKHWDSGEPRRADISRSTPDYRDLPEFIGIVSNSYKWRRRESNPRPRMGQSKPLRAYCPVAFATGRGQDTADPELATEMSRPRRGSTARRPARTVVASRSRIGRTSPETDRGGNQPYAAIAMLLLAFVKFPVGLARFRESRHAASTSPSTSKP